MVNKYAGIDNDKDDNNTPIMSKQFKIDKSFLDKSISHNEFILPNINNNQKFIFNKKIGFNHEGDD